MLWPWSRAEIIGNLQRSLRFPPDVDLCLFVFLSSSFSSTRYRRFFSFAQPVLALECKKEQFGSLWELWMLFLFFVSIVTCIDNTQLSKHKLFMTLWKKSMRQLISSMSSRNNRKSRSKHFVCRWRFVEHFVQRKRKIDRFLLSAVFENCFS